MALATTGFIAHQVDANGVIAAVARITHNESATRRCFDRRSMRAAHSKTQNFFHVRRLFAHAAVGQHEGEGRCVFDAAEVQRRTRVEEERGRDLARHID